MSVASSHQSVTQDEIDRRTAQRLRESEKEANTELFEAGKKAGIEWVKGCVSGAGQYVDGMAEAREIRHLKRHLNDRQQWNLDDVVDEVGATQAHSPSEQFFFAIHGENHRDTLAAAEWWEVVVGEEMLKGTRDHDEVPWLNGFSEGAIEAYDSLI